MDKNLGTNLQWRIGTILFLRRSLQFATLWMFLWGTFTVAWRVSQNAMPSWLMFGAWGFLPLAIAAGYFAWRQVPSAASVRSLIDRHSRYGGLLMAADEQALGSWAERLPEPAAIRLRWRSARTLIPFALAAGFLVASFCFPQEYVQGNESGLEIGGDVRKLTTNIDMLKEEKIIPPQQADFLKEKLKQIQDDAVARNPKKTFDALDQLRSSVNRTATAAAKDAKKKSQHLSKAEKLAEAIAKENSTLDDKLKKEAMEELAKLVDKAAEENDLANKGLDPQTLDDLHKGDLTPEELKKLADALKDSQAQNEDLVEKLARARLIDPADLREAEENPDGEPAEKSDLAQLLGRQPPGKKKSKDGPGHPDIAWTDGTKSDGAKFKEQALPPGTVASLKNSTKIALGKTPPKPEKAVPSAGGAIQNAAPGGGEASTQVVMPQHRAAVQRFFAR